jgi:hypothetical protein
MPAHKASIREGSRRDGAGSEPRGTAPCGRPHSPLQLLRAVSEHFDFAPFDEDLVSVPLPRLTRLGPVDLPTRGSGFTSRSLGGP